MRRKPRLCWLMRFIAVAGVVSVGAAAAADRGFPFDSELLLDVRPMKGSKRVPMMDVAADGHAAIELWCNSVEGQVAVVESSITVTTGRQTDRQCDPARMRGDEELLAALVQATSWSREGNLLTLRGSKTLRFRQPTN
jgi:heat shock protein HslJ